MLPIVSGTSRSRRPHHRVGSGILRFDVHRVRWASSTRTAERCVQLAGLKARSRSAAASRCWRRTCGERPFDALKEPDDNNRFETESD